MEAHKAQVANRNQEHRAAYAELGAETLNLHDELVENDSTQMVDFDGKSMQLFSYKYKMGDAEPVLALVKKGSETNKLTSKSYNYLLSIKHNLLLPLENFYEKGSNRNGWFILSCIQGSLEAWLKSGGDKIMFEGNGAKKNMANTFRTLIIDIWSLLSDMSEELLYPERIRLQDLFVKMLPGGKPRIQMLLTEFRVLHKTCSTKTEEWERVQDDVKLLITQCCQACNVELSETSEKFCKYAFDFQRKSILELKNYPDNWSYDQKACYLYHVISDSPFEKHKMRSKINHDTELKWPKNVDGSDLPVITMLLALKCNKRYDEKERRWVSNYEKDKAYDYLQLFRNHHKHFDELLPHEKEMLSGSREGLIQCMETWEPNIWILLYEVIGPAGRQLDE